MARNTRSVTIEQDVTIELSDGIKTYADVYRPSGPGRFPVLLSRSPYNKSTGDNARLQTDLFNAVSRGYAVVIQDVRGRYTSEGHFNPFLQEIRDGYDSIEWSASQPWSNGRVGMFGTSYVGATQWLAAISRPKALKAIVPAFTSSDYYEGWTYQGGALQWGFMCNWALPYLTSADMLRRHEQTPVQDLQGWSDRIVSAVDAMPETVRTLPLSSLPISAEWSPYFYDWLAHPTRDDFWKARSIEDRHDQVEVPALSIAGWYDIFLDGSIRNFTGVREKGATAAARDGSRLILGPWTHTAPPQAVAGSVDFGMRAGQGYSPLSKQTDMMSLDFLDRWVREVDTKPDLAPVQLFVMGEGVWRDEQEWPLRRARSTEFFLHSDGSANSARGDGRLTTTRPGSERPDVFLYDPFHPVQTVGGQLCCYPAQLAPGVFDQRGVEERTDVLVYMTEPLRSDVEVTGQIILTLYAATTAPDTDFTAKLVDIFPTGEVRNLTDGIIRARYRQGTDMARPITPNEVTEYTIDLWSTSNLFRAGHRIGLEIASSNFPRFDRNLNTGNPIADDTEMRPALQTVHHDGEYPSRLVLPIIPR